MRLQIENAVFKFLRRSFDEALKVVKVIMVLGPFNV